MGTAIKELIEGLMEEDIGELVNGSEAASLLRVKPGTVRFHVSAGHLKVARKVLGHNLYRRADIEALKHEKRRPGWVRGRKRGSKVVSEKKTVITN